jgi:hypothetical protein
VEEKIMKKKQFSYSQDGDGKEILMLDITGMFTSLCKDELPLSLIQRR